VTIIIIIIIIIIINDLIPYWNANFETVLFCTLAFSTLLAVPVAAVSIFAKNIWRYNTQNFSRTRKCVIVLIMVTMLRFPLISAANYLILEVGLLSLPFHLLVFGYVITDYMKFNITSSTRPTMA